LVGDELLHKTFPRAVAVGEHVRQVPDISEALPVDWPEESAA
jgi:hypothetical protein